MNSSVKKLYKLKLAGNKVIIYEGYWAIRRNDSTVCFCVRSDIKKLWHFYVTNLWSGK